MGDLLPENANDRRFLVRFLLALVAFKLLVAALAPLGVDEAYAVAVAREYSLAFFDHPPLSFWLPVGLAQLTGVEHPVIYRLPFILAGLLTTWAIYGIGQRIGGPRVARASALLHVAAPFFLVSGGLLVVPDGTLNLGLAFSVLFLLRILGADNRAPLHQWIAVGTFLALALASKYQAAWLPVAVLLFMVLTPTGRKWFVQPGPWIAAGIGLVGLLPTVLWNMDHGWASFAFHTGRAENGGSLANAALMMVGQAVFLLPTGLVAGVAGVALGWRRRGEQPALFLLALLAIGPILFFNYIYFTSSGTLAHWPMPGWLFALPLGALWINNRGERFRRLFRRTGAVLALALWVPLLALVVHARTGWLTAPFHDRPPKWDNTLMLFDYGGLRGALERRGLWKGADVLMATTWIDGGLLDTALKGKRPMRIIEPSAAHHFAYISDASASGTALYLRPSRLEDTAQTGAKMLRRARKLDAGAKLLRPIILKRGKQPYVAVNIVRLCVN